MRIPGQGGWGLVPNLVEDDEEYVIDIGGALGRVGDPHFRILHEPLIDLFLQVFFVHSGDDIAHPISEGHPLEALASLHLESPKFAEVRTRMFPRLGNPRNRKSYSLS